MKIFQFDVDFPSDYAAGLDAYNEKIEVKFMDGGIIDGEDRAFIKDMCEVFEAWFDGAYVSGKRKR